MSFHGKSSSRSQVRLVAVLGFVLVVLAAGVVLLSGAFGGWNDSESQTQVLTGAVVDLCGVDDVCETTFGSDLAGLLPGDSGVRAITLANTGDVDLSSVSLSLDTSNDVLDEDLKLRIDRCDSSYTPPASDREAPVCSSNWQPVVAEVAVGDVGDVNLLTGTLPHTSANTKGFKFTYTLADTTSNATVGASTSLTYTLVAQQRAGVIPPPETLRQVGNVVSREASSGTGGDSAFFEVYGSYLAVSGDGSYVYQVSMGGLMAVVNVDDPGGFEVVGELDLPQGFYGPYLGVSASLVLDENEEVLYVPGIEIIGNWDGLEQKIFKVDVSNPQSPSVVDELEIPLESFGEMTIYAGTFGGGALDVNGDYLYYTVNGDVFDGDPVASKIVKIDIGTFTAVEEMLLPLDFESETGPYADLFFNSLKLSPDGTTLYASGSRALFVAEELVPVVVKVDVGTFTVSGAYVSAPTGASESYRAATAVTVSPDGQTLHVLEAFIPLFIMWGSGGIEVPVAGVTSISSGSMERIGETKLLVHPSFGDGRFLNTVTSASLSPSGRFLYVTGWQWDDLDDGFPVSNVVKLDLVSGLVSGWLSYGTDREEGAMGGGAFA